MTHDILEISGMEFFAKIGCFEEEKITANKFIIDLIIVLDCNKAAISDDLTDAIDYRLIYDIVKIEMQQKCNLIENVAKRILDKLINSVTEIKEITIKLSKINPVLGGKLDKVSVIFNKKNV